MAVTTWTDVPAHRIRHGRRTPTVAYIRLMARVGRALKAGGEVDYSARAADAARQEGDVIDWISVTISGPPEGRA